MKILVVSQYFYPEDFKINDVVEYLLGAGHDVNVLTAYPNYPGGSFFDGYGFFDSYPKNFKGARVYRTPIIPRKNNSINLLLNYLTFPIFSRTRAMKIQQRFKPDVVLGYQLSPIWSVFPATILKNRFKVPFVLWCLDLWPESFLSNFSYRNFIIDRYVSFSSEQIYRSADFLAVTTKSFRSQLAKISDRSEGDISFLPNWAEDIFMEIPKKSFTLNSELFNVVFAGNIGDSQGLDVLINAARLTKKQNIVWHLFGEGRYKGKLRQSAERLNLSNIIFHGRIDLNQIPSIYSESNALLLTLKPKQGFSRTIPGKFAGYLTSGKPIISNIEGEVKTVIEQYKLGDTFSGNSSEELAKVAMKIKAYSKTELDEISQNSKKYYKNHFAKDKVLGDLERILIAAKL